MRQLKNVNLVSPGFRGLNLSREHSVIDQSYATDATNAMIDNAGRLAARSGYSTLTTTPIAGTPAVQSMIEFRQSDGFKQVIFSYDGGISNDMVDPLAGDLSGAVDVADGNWWFQNFRDTCIGFQDGQRPITYNGSGTFAPVVENSGTAPHGRVGAALYGRVWGVDSDGKTIKYSALLDETRWDVADGGGSLDMTTVWTEGTDTITAIAGFNGSLVVFGHKHIIFWLDAGDSELGINPQDMYVNDVVTGTGCIGQETIQPLGETDMFYVSDNGVQSLVRVTQSTSNPVNTLSAPIRSQLLSYVNGAVPNTVRSAYSAKYGLYLLTFPAVSDSTSGLTYAFDTKFPYEDPLTGVRLNIITTWTLAPTAWCAKQNGTLLGGLGDGIIEYGGSTLDDGETFRFIYQSPWLDFGEDFADRVKLMKRLGAIIYVQGATQVIYSWGTDFSEDKTQVSKEYAADGLAEWGIAEFDIAEFSGGLNLQIIKLAARARGQYFRLGVEAVIDGEFAIQQLELFTKIGRLA